MPEMLARPGVPANGASAAHGVRRAARKCTLALVLPAALGAGGCSPALDWREARTAGSGFVALFPCKPRTLTRTVPLAGAPVALSMHACSAGGVTWALAHADLGDPARVGPALSELRGSAAANIGAGAARELPLPIKGLTPNPASVRLRLEGRLPDGRAVVEQIALFSRGTVVLQATALGETLPDEAAETFFAALRAAT
jgi:hypothetical protein